MKRITSIIFLTALLISMGITALAAMPNQTSTFYVNDFAEIFTEEQEALLLSRALELKEKHDDVQMVVSTVNSLDGMEAGEYGTEMINKYGIGYNDMGILILFAPNEREIFVSTGYRMENYITDLKAGQLLDKHAMPEIKNGNYSKGLIDLHEALVQEIDLRITKEAEWESKKPEVIRIFGIFILLLIFGIGHIVFIVSRDKKFKELVYSNSCLENELEAVKNNREKKIDALANNLVEVKKELSQSEEDLKHTQESLSFLNDKYARACKLHPNLETEVAKDKAEEIKKNDLAEVSKTEELIKKSLLLPIKKESIAQINTALKRFSSLNSRQLSYTSEDFKNNLGKLKQLYLDCLEKQYDYDASIIISDITAIIAGISVAKASHLDSLKRAQQEIDSLDSNMKKRVDKDLIAKVSTLLGQAKKDKEREEQEEEAEEERRRARRNSSLYSSSSSSFSSSSGSGGGFSGGGGSSGGGGAGRSW